VRSCKAGAITADARVLNVRPARAVAYLSIVPIITPRGKIMAASAFFHFLWENPAVPALIVLVLLLMVVPVAMCLYRRLRHKEQRVDAPQTTRFVGIQLDLAILVFGLFLLLVVLG